MPSKKLVKPDNPDKSNIWIFSIMLGGGLLGLLASFVLTLDHLQLAKDPDAVLQCSINLVLNCGIVMQTDQAALFGFPNMLIGLVGFPIVITIAMAGLFKTKFPKRFMQLANIGVAAGALLAYWLFFNSVYVIQALCPWCLLVTVAMSALLLVFTHYNARQLYIGTSKRSKQAIAKFFTGGYDNFVFACWIVALFIIVYLKFGNDLFM